MANLTTIHGGNITLILDPDLCTLETCDLSLAHLTYLPSVWGNAIFVGVFGLALPIQIFLGIKYKTWGFMLAMFLCLALEVVGYIIRVILHYEPFIKDNFILYLIFLTIAPAFLSAGIYLCLSRIVILFGPSLSRLNARTYTIVFCTSDLVSLILQGVGGALASVGETEEDVDAGTDIMIAGLIFQVVSLFGFVALCADYAWSLYRHQDKWNTNNIAIYGSRLFKWFMSGLAFATLMIIIRCTFRAIELSDGFDGEMANDEVLYMILEPPMIALAVIALTIFHPGVCFQGAWLSTSTKNFKKAGNKKMSERVCNDDGNSYLGSGEDTELDVIERGEGH